MTAPGKPPPEPISSQWSAYGLIRSELRAVEDMAGPEIGTSTAPTILIRVAQRRKTISKAISLWNVSRETLPETKRNSSKEGAVTQRPSFRPLA